MESVGQDTDSRTALEEEAEVVGIAVVVRMNPVPEAAGTALGIHQARATGIQQPEGVQAAGVPDRAKLGTAMRRQQEEARRRQPIEKLEACSGCASNESRGRPRMVLGATVRARWYNARDVVDKT